MTLRRRCYQRYLLNDLGRFDAALHYVIRCLFFGLKKCEMLETSFCENAKCSNVGLRREFDGFFERLDSVDGELIPIRPPICLQRKRQVIEADDADSTLYVGDGGSESLAFSATGATGAPATGIRAVYGKADFVFTGRRFHALSELF